MRPASREVTWKEKVSVYLGIATTERGIAKIKIAKKVLNGAIVVVDEFRI